MVKYKLSQRKRLSKKLARRLPSLFNKCKDYTELDNENIDVLMVVSNRNKKPRYRTFMSQRNMSWVSEVYNIINDRENNLIEYAEDVAMRMASSKKSAEIKKAKTLAEAVASDSEEDSPQEADSPYSEEEFPSFPDLSLTSVFANFRQSFTMGCRTEEFSLMHNDLLM